MRIYHNVLGLNNDMLDKYDKFDERAGTSIISYLSHYPRPICLIAHNGKRYDFPLIKKTFDKIQLVSGSNGSDRYIHI